MVGSLTLILLLAVVGDCITDALGLPVPGPAIGLLLLTLIFVVREGPDQGSAALFDAVSPHFPLFFVPAAVGVVANADILSRSWFLFAAAVVLGTSVTLVTTGWITQCLLHGRGREPARQRGKQQQESVT